MTTRVPARTLPAPPGPAAPGRRWLTLGVVAMPAATESVTGALPRLARRPAGHTEPVATKARRPE